VKRIADDILMIDRAVMVLDMSLEQIRENYRRISLGFATVAPKLECVRGIDKMRQDGRQITILASSNAEAIAQLGRQHGTVAIDVSPINLRQIFLERCRTGTNRTSNSTGSGKMLWYKSWREMRTVILAGIVGCPHRFPEVSIG
jgi:ABC-type uncharacterized transport system ATPase subunit